MKNYKKLLPFFILTVFFVGFLSFYNKIQSATNSWVSDFGQIRANGSSDSGVRSTQVTDLGIFQAYMADWNTSYEGFGAFGPSGGKYAVDGCISSNGAMWSGSVQCWNFVDANGSGNVGNSAGHSSFTRDIGSNPAPATYAIGSYYVNDAVVYPRIIVYGRSVSINGFNTTNSAPIVGQAFDVTWDASERTDDSVLTYSGPVSCSPSSNPYTVSTNSGGITCTGTGIGPASFHLEATGYGGNGVKTVSDDLVVNILSPGMVGLNFYVKNQNNSNISGATVTINKDFGNGVSRTTDGGGFANFGVDKNVSVGWTVSISGCSSKSGTANIGTVDVTVNVSLDCITTPGGTPPSASPAVGVLESASCTEIKGFAGDPDDWNQSINVYLVKDNNYYGTPAGTIVTNTLANLSRPDVNAAYGVPGNHGFSFATPDSLKDGIPHTIYVHPLDISGTPNNAIAQSGSFTINCPRVVTTPTVTAIDVPASATPNGSSQYDVIVTSNDTAGASKISQIYAYMVSPGRSPGYSGFITWGAGNYWPAEKNNQVCTGGGYAAIQQNSPNSNLGHQYTNLVGCTTTVSGNVRTVKFTITLNPTFSTPLTGNYVVGYAYNGDNFSPAFGSSPFYLNMPQVNNVTISPNPVNPNGTSQYSIQVTATDPTSGSNIVQEYALINHQGSNAGAYRGYLTWGTSGNVWWPSDKNLMTCTGGGWAAIQSTGGNTNYGHQYMNLVSCSTSVSGNTRTTTFNVNFNPAFKTAGPLTNNDISGFTFNAFGHGGLAGGVVDWYNPDQNFSLAVNDAQFVSQTVPTTMTPGQTQSVTVTMKNTGTNTWTQASNYKLGSQNPTDNQTFVTGARVLLSGADSVARNSNKTFTFNITAPSTPGTYNFQWRMVQENVEWFGETTPNIPIVVSAATQPDLTAGAVTPTSATAGTPTAFTSTISNGGTASTGASFNNLFQVATGAGGAGTVSTISVTSRAAIGAGSTGTVTSSSYTFPSSGTYSVRVCADNNASFVGAITESNEGNNCGSWTNVAVSPAAAATLTASPSTGTAGVGSLTAAFTNVSSPASLDWIGLYQVGTADSAFIDWVWASDCTRTTPTTSAPGRANGSCNNFPMPGTAGTYEFRMFSNNTYTPNTPTSNSVVVSGGATNYLLSVSANPGPGGSVTGPGISCGADCSESVAAGTVVNLTAVPASSFWKFNGWTGCDSVSGTQCTITVNSSRSVNASFGLRLFFYKEF